MTEELFTIPPSEPDALTKARIEYEKALETLEKCHKDAIALNEQSQLALSFTDTARKAVERARLTLEHAERWAARR